MNYGLFAAIYAMFHAVHGIADYWLQSDKQAQNKSKNWEALLDHTMSYSSTFLALLGVPLLAAGVPTWKICVLPLVIGIPHAWMDRRSFLNWFLKKTKGWEPGDLRTMAVRGMGMDTIAQTAAIRTHVAIHMDQKFHYLCLLLTAAWLAWDT